MQTVNFQKSAVPFLYSNIIITYFCYILIALTCAGLNGIYMVQVFWEQFLEKFCYISDSLYALIQFCKISILPVQMEFGQQQKYMLVEIYNNSPFFNLYNWLNGPALRSEPKRTSTSPKPLRLALPRCSSARWASMGRTSSVACQMESMESQTVGCKRTVRFLRLQPYIDGVEVSRSESISNTPPERVRQRELSI